MPSLLIINFWCIEKDRSDQIAIKGISNSATSPRADHVVSIIVKKTMTWQPHWIKAPIVGTMEYSLDSCEIKTLLSLPMLMKPTVRCGGADHEWFRHEHALEPNTSIVPRNWPSSTAANRRCGTPLLLFDKSTSTGERYRASDKTDPWPRANAGYSTFCFQSYSRRRMQFSTCCSADAVLRRSLQRAREVQVLKSQTVTMLKSWRSSSAIVTQGFW